MVTLIKNSLIPIRNRFVASSLMVSIAFHFNLDLHLFVFLKKVRKNVVFKKMFIISALVRREAFLIFRAGLWELNFSGA